MNAPVPNVHHPQLGVIIDEGFSEETAGSAVQAWHLLGSNKA
jgi:hypothetical protein